MSFLALSEVVAFLIIALNFGTILASFMILRKTTGIVVILLTQALMLGGMARPLLIL